MVSITNQLTLETETPINRLVNFQYRLENVEVSQALGTKTNYQRLTITISPRHKLVLALQFNFRV